jgi:hypothetical protein
MAFGDNQIDGELRRSWHEFAGMLRSAGDHMFKDESGCTDGERTNAFRYLTQNISQAFDIWLENRDTRNPTVHAFCGPTRKLGCDNADCIYLQSWINDEDTYKISGNRGTARMFNIAVQGPWQGDLHEPFGDTPVANVFGDDLELDWDGNFVLWVSPDPQPGNWIRSTPGARKIFYRQYFDTWDEVPASLRIQRVGPDDAAAPPPLSPSQLMEAFQQAGAFVVNVAKDWPETMWEREGTREIFNRFVRHGGPPSKGAEADAVDSRKGRVVASLNWDFDDDEALIVEFRADPGWFWQITACTVFGASLEYRYRQVSLTSGMSPVDRDGFTRVVVCDDDPGYANWIDAQDHRRGWLFFRNMFTRVTPDWEARVVKRAALDHEIGNVAQRITPEQRRAELRRRRQANLRRFPT